MRKNWGKMGKIAVPESPYIHYLRCYAEGVRHGEYRKKTVLDFDKASPRKG